ncbi:Heat-inducible transcription repressor HrcA [Dirofilaria immitis]
MELLPTYITNTGSTNNQSASMPSKAELKRYTKMVTTTKRRHRKTIYELSDPRNRPNLFTSYSSSSSSSSVFSFTFLVVTAIAIAVANFIDNPPINDIFRSST